jgi:hypothetical protein
VVGTTALRRQPPGPAPAQTGPAPGELAWPVPPVAGRVLVEVLNTTDRTGQARLAARLLRAEGLDVIAVGNAAPKQAATRVIVRRGSGSGARDAVRALGAGRVTTELDTLRRVDLTVLLGEDFHPVTPVHP